MSHTPGKWATEPTSPHNPSIITAPTSNCVVATANVELSEFAANALLIAAAPELLAALTDLLDDWKDTIRSHCDDVAVEPPVFEETVLGKRVIAAIAKATGESNG